MAELSVAQLISLLPEWQSTLESLIVHLTSPPPSLIIQASHVQALTATLLRSILTTSESLIGSHRAVFIDCIEVHNAKILYDRVLNDLSNWSPKWEQGQAPNWQGQNLEANLTLEDRTTSKADQIAHRILKNFEKSNESISLFFTALKELCQQSSGHTFIIFGTAERLLEFNDVGSSTGQGSFISAMSRAQEFVRFRLLPDRNLISLCTDRSSDHSDFFKYAGS